MKHRSDPKEKYAGNRGLRGGSGSSAYETITYHDNYLENLFKTKES